MGNVRRTKGHPYAILKTTNTPQTMIPLITNHTDQLAEICRTTPRQTPRSLRLRSRRRLQPREKRTSNFLVEFNESGRIFSVPNPQRSDTRTGVPLKPLRRHSDFRQRRKPLLPIHQSRARGNRSLRHDSQSYLWDIQQAAQRMQLTDSRDDIRRIQRRIGMYICWLSDCSSPSVKR